MASVCEHSELYMMFVNTIAKLKLVLENENRKLIIKKIEEWIILLEISAIKRYQHIQTNTIMDYNGIYDKIATCAITDAALEYIESTK
jgi:hypothetical protein